MKGVDTNILVRFLVGDDKAQAKKVYAIFKKAEADRQTLFVPFVVVVELIWVLESVYQIARTDIVDSVNALLSMSILKFEHHMTLQQWVSATQTNKHDLADLLIVFCARDQGCESVIIFDKKAATYDLFELA
ncbi:MAG: type II toxin-antitoxin system VapC family toxin [Burkholderiales bacterium]|nr:type II toxin-antitoxin system VapC family toxin [Burkholderiales bacterium]